MPAGDPVTLRLHVSGAGNFDRVDSQMLERNDQWKTYPPKSSFSATDLLGYKGEKTFEQPLIAAQSGDQTIPALSFSYFDPETKRYERAQTAPIKVTIDAPRAASTLEAAAAPGARVANRAAELLRPDHAPTPAAATLVPLYLQPRYLAIPAALALLLAAGWFARRRAPRDAVPKATQRALDRLSGLERSGDAAAFYVAARELLRESFSRLWHLPVEEISAAELDARLGPDAADVSRLFALADEAKYSGLGATSADLAPWLQLVRRHLPGASP
jgi:hypothetical protein